jgi:long-chain acyl-CoA synthetase
MGLWIPPILRAEVHFENRFIASKIVDRIHRGRISVLAAVPRVFALLKSHFESNDPSLIQAISASEGMKAWQRWWQFRRIHRQLGLKFWRSSLVAAHSRPLLKNSSDLSAWSSFKVTE